MTNTQVILSGLARAKAVFQLRAIRAATGIGESDCLEQCAVCGDYHGERDAVPYTCMTGDGV